MPLAAATVAAVGRIAADSRGDRQRAMSRMMAAIERADAAPSHDDLCPLVEAAEEEVVVPLELLGRR
eukprot:gene20514-17647_t